MANTLAGFGFRGGQPGNASAPTFAMNQYQIAYNDTIDIGWGDPVTMTSSGVVTGTSTTFSTNGMVGIFRGCSYADSTAPGGLRFLNYWPGVALGSSSTVVTAFVETDPTAVYLAQTSGAALAVTNIGNNLDIVSGTGSAPNAAGISTCVLDVSSAATTALPFRIVGILGVGWLANAPPPISGGSVTDTNGWVYVKINNSLIYSTTTGV